MKPVETRYARSGTVRIAYQAIGHGAFDLVFVPGFISNLEMHWEEPGYAKLLNRFAAFSRLIQFDKRGTGLSDRVDAWRASRPRDPHGRRACRDGRDRQRAGGIVRRIRRRADVDPVCRDLSGANALAGALWRLCAFPDLGHGNAKRSTVSSTAPRSGGALARRLNTSRRGWSTIRISANGGDGSSECRRARRLRWR